MGHVTLQNSGMPVKTWHEDLNAQSARATPVVPVGHSLSLDIAYTQRHIAYSAVLIALACQLHIKYFSFGVLQSRFLLKTLGGIMGVPLRASLHCVRTARYF